MVAPSSPESRAAGAAFASGFFVTVSGLLDRSERSSAIGDRIDRRGVKSGTVVQRRRHRLA